MLLPNVVLFPETQIPLLIFEPRYRQMVEDVMRSDQRFAIFLTHPNLPEQEGTARLGCLGEMIGFQKLPNGYYQVLLKGEKRIQRLSWDSSRSYPFLSYREVPDIPFPNEQISMQVKTHLLKRARDYLAMIQTKKEALEKTLETALRLSTSEIIHWACILLQFDINRKQSILEESELLKRSQAVVAVLEEKIKEQAFLQEFARPPSDPRLN